MLQIWHKDFDLGKCFFLGFRLTSFFWDYWVPYKFSDCHCAQYTIVLHYIRVERLIRDKYSSFGELFISHEGNEVL